MSDIHVTLSGNVTDDPRQYQFRDGSRVTSLRMAVNRRVLDQQTNTWQTRDTTYYTVRCYRGLGDNVHQSIRKGHPVVVYGKLRIKQFERDGEQRFWAEIEASSVGHDLKWGITSFEKPLRAFAGAAPTDDDRQGMEDATKEWELATPAAPRSVDELRLPFGVPGDGGADDGFADGDDDRDGPSAGEIAAAAGRAPGDRRDADGAEAGDGPAAPAGTAGAGETADDAEDDGVPWIPRALAA
ncbi:single-stranded DNA-binding protein [Microbispora sp. ATCC PTA-5024]|uniref:single-stranded DNA-binding protein n=1 Tax=Microbispora sp. ATCC PTA-5024 TaxID=316330 RepID=UPI0003DCE721|nr:single-stranded DNA-binding protein [Microbispora sp. ATCC PTA-5024]ETK31333.1 hypothetical protein MPTA5024_35485 [Microbispora sp. ATCC PTA-5024]